jgi:hypothetical protein
MRILSIIYLSTLFLKADPIDDLINRDVINFFNEMASSSQSIKKDYFKTIKTHIEKGESKKAYYYFYKHDLKFKISESVRLINTALIHKNIPLSKAFSELLFESNDHKTILKFAILSHYFEVAEFFLKEFKNLNLNSIVYPDTNRTLLHIAVIDNDNKVVRFLLKHKIEIDAKDIYGFTPLFYIQSKKVLKLFKNGDTEISSLAKCTILLNEKKVNDAVKYCLQKAKISEKHNYIIGASWYYLLARKPLKSKQFSKELSNKGNRYIGNVNLAHYYLLTKEYDKAKRLYENFVNNFSDINESKRVLIEDFTTLRKIYPNRFNIYKAFDIYHEISGDRI